MPAPMMTTLFMLAPDGEKWGLQSNSHEIESLAQIQWHFPIRGPASGVVIRCDHRLQTLPWQQRCARGAGRQRLSKKTPGQGVLRRRPAFTLVEKLLGGDDAACEEVQFIGGHV